MLEVSFLWGLGCVGELISLPSSMSNVNFISSDTFSRHAEEVYNIFQVERLPQIT